MFKKYIIFIFSLLFLISKGQVLNLTSLESFEEKRIVLPKPVLIFMHTDWCSICRVQERILVKEAKIPESLSDKIYFINFNSEKQKNRINFFGHQYSFISNGNSGIHELAMKLSGDSGSIVYPLWILLDKNGKVIFRHEGLIKREELIKILSALS